MRSEREERTAVEAASSEQEVPEARMLRSNDERGPDHADGNQHGQPAKLTGNRPAIRPPAKRFRVEGSTEKPVLSRQQRQGRPDGERHSGVTSNGVAQSRSGSRLRRSSDRRRPPPTRSASASAAPGARGSSSGAEIGLGPGLASAAMTDATRPRGTIQSSFFSMRSLPIRGQIFYDVCQQEGAKDPAFSNRPKALSSARGSSGSSPAAACSRSPDAPGRCGLPQASTPKPRPRPPRISRRRSAPCSR